MLQCRTERFVAPQTATEPQNNPQTATDAAEVVLEAATHELRVIGLSCVIYQHSGQVLPTETGGCDCSSFLWLAKSQALLEGSDLKTCVVYNSCQDFMMFLFGHRVLFGQPTFRLKHV